MRRVRSQAWLRLSTIKTRSNTTVETKTGQDHDLCHALVHRCLTSKVAEELLTRDHLARTRAESIMKYEEIAGIKEAVTIAIADTIPHLIRHILRLKKEVEIAVREILRTAAETTAKDTRMSRETINIVDMVEGIVEVRQIMTKNEAVHDLQLTVVLETLIEAIRMQILLI